MTTKAPARDSSLAESDSEKPENPTSQPLNTVIDPNIVWLPTKPPRPAPPLLTDEEVVLLLRLDPKKGRRTVRHYVAKGMLKANRFGPKLKFRLTDVMTFINDKGE